MFYPSYRNLKGGCVTAENMWKKARCGTWNEKTTHTQIKDEKGNVIGYRRYLVFQINEIDSVLIRVKSDGLGCMSLDSISNLVKRKLDVKKDSCMNKKTVYLMIIWASDG